MKSHINNDLKQESDGWKRHQKKMEKIIKEQMQSFPWTTLDCNVESMDDAQDCLQMCGNIEEYKRYYSE